MVFMFMIVFSLVLRIGSSSLGREQAGRCVPDAVMTFSILSFYFPPQLILFAFGELQVLIGTPLVSKLSIIGNLADVVTVNLS